MSKSSITELKSNYSVFNAKKLKEYHGIINLDTLDLFQKMQVRNFAHQQWKSLNHQNDPNDAIWATLANVLDDMIAIEVLDKFTDSSFS